MSKPVTRRIMQKRNKKIRQKRRNLANRQEWTFPFSFEDISGERQMERKLKKQNAIFDSVAAIVVITFIILLITKSEGGLMKLLLRD